jgi:hypothetical protein
MIHVNAPRWLPARGLDFGTRCIQHLLIVLEEPARAKV